MDSPMTEEQRTAKLNVDAAIREFYELVKPSSYVENWLLILNTADLDDSSQDSVTYEESSGMDWIRRRGMLEIAAQHARNIQAKALDG